MSQIFLKRPIDEQLLNAIKSSDFATFENALTAGANFRVNVYIPYGTEFDVSGLSDDYSRFGVDDVALGIASRGSYLGVKQENALKILNQIIKSKEYDLENLTKYLLFKTNDDNCIHFLLSCGANPNYKPAPSMLSKTVWLAKHGLPSALKICFMHGADPEQFTEKDLDFVFKRQKQCFQIVERARRGEDFSSELDLYVPIPREENPIALEALAEPATSINLNIIKFNGVSRKSERDYELVAKVLQQVCNGEMPNLDADDLSVVENIWAEVQGEIEHAKVSHKAPGQLKLSFQ